MARPAIRITLIDRLGKRGCHRGHRVGESFDFDTERGKLSKLFQLGQIHFGLS